MIRWISLPLAAFTFIGPLWSVAWEYQYYSGKLLADAKILSAKMVDSGNRGTGAYYDVDVRFRLGDHFDERSLRVNSYRSLAAGDTIRVYVDPKNGDAEDDTRLGSWIVVGWGLLASIFFVFVGFRYGGKMLREGRLLGR